MIPRIDKLNPPDDRRIPTRQVTLEKLVDGELDTAIADAIPPSSFPSHDLLGHQNAYDLTVGSGVNVVVGAGRARIDNTTYVHGTTPMALTVNATNYIKVSAVGALFSSTSPAASGQIPLWAVTTNATDVTSYTDLRAVFSNGGGGGGGGGASTLDDAYDGGTPGSGSGRIIDANDGEVLIRNLEADANANLRIQRAPAEASSAPLLQADLLAEAQPRFSVYGNRMQGSWDGSALGSSPADWFLGHYQEQCLALHNNGTLGQSLDYRVTNAADGAQATPSTDRTRQYTRTVGGTQSLAFLKDSTGKELGPLGTKDQATITGFGSSGAMEPPQGATWSDGIWGTLMPVTSWTATGTPSVANDTGLISGGIAKGRYIQAQAAAGVGNDAGFNTDLMFWINKGDAMLVRFELMSSSNIRCFIGMAAQTLATMVGANDPGTNHMGLQFSTPRGDTNWQWTERGTGGAQTLTSTGVGGGTGVFYLKIITGITTEYQLLNSSGVIQHTKTGSVTNKPGATTLLRLIAGIENQDAAATKEMRIYQFVHHARQA